MTIPVLEIVGEEPEVPHAFSPRPSLISDRSSRVASNVGSQATAKPGAQAPVGTTTTEIGLLLVSRPTAAVLPATGVENTTIEASAASGKAKGCVIDYGGGDGGGNSVGNGVANGVGIGVGNGVGNGGEEEEEPFRLHILLAEDSIPNQKLMVRILQRAGHTVEAVSFTLRTEVCGSPGQASAVNCRPSDDVGSFKGS